MDTQEFSFIGKALKKANGENDNSITSKAKQSVIVRFLNKISDTIYKKVLSSIICMILTMFDSIEHKFEQSKIASFFNKGDAKKVNAVKDFKIGLLKQVESSKIINFVKNAISSLGDYSLRTYGIGILFFGLYTCGVQLFKSSALISGMFDITYFAVGIILIVVSVIALTSKKSIVQAINDSLFLGFILFNLLGFRKNITHEAKSGKKYSATFALVGVALGILTFVINPLYIIGLFALFALILLIIHSCEAGLLLSLFVLPFAPTKVMIALVILDSISFLLKYLSGKRTIKFSILDFAIMTFTLLYLIGGFFSYGPNDSIKASLVYICFICGYFLVKNMLRSPTFIDRAFIVISTSLIIVSVIGILEFFVGNPSNIWQDHTLFSSLKGRVVSTFNNPNVLAEYLIMAFPVSFALLLTVKEKWKIVLTSISSFTSLVCLVLTWSRGAWIGLFIAVLLSLIFYSKYLLTSLILVLPPSLSVLFFTNNPITQRISSITNFSDSTSSYRIQIWESTLRLLKDNIWLGIGVGESAFTTVFPFYASSGITSAYHSHSLYLQILTENGIFAFIVFAIIIVLFVQVSLSYIRNAASVTHKVRGLGLFCAIIAVLLMGVTDHIWYNYKIFLMFWSIIGLSVAHITYAKESTEENRITY